MKKILVIQNKRIGDVLLASIIPNNLKKIFPNSLITFFCYDYAAPVLYNNPNIDKIISVNERDLKNRNYFFKMSMNLRQENFDLLIDPYVKIQSQMISVISGAEERISYKKKVLPHAYTKRVPILKHRISPYGKAIDDRVNLIKHFCPKMNFDVYPKLYLTEQEEREGAAKMNPLDKSKKTLMFGVLGSDPSKSMPIQYISEIINYITENYDLNILLNYMPSQKDIIPEILQNVKSRDYIYCDIIGDDIREFIKLMNHCDFLVANEGGSVHIAKALDKPTFTIYSPYILKDAWATFENNSKNQSIHLEEVRPELFKDKSRMEISATSADLYKAFTPDLIISQLKKFMDEFGK